MRRTRCTKVIATLGPASSNAAAIQALFEAGADVFRFNMSHGTHSEHRQRLMAVRDIERKAARPIGVMADLQGPKIRLGRFTGGQAVVIAGQRVRFELEAMLGDECVFPLPHPEVFRAGLGPGATLLVDDGKLAFTVSFVGAGFVETMAARSGIVSDCKGVNLPDCVLPMPALTAKDWEDLEFALMEGFDLIALSFVQTPGDVDTLRTRVGDRAAIVAKIEKPAALEHLAEIVERADAIMIARGDLGVEMPPEQLPMIQRRIVRECRRQGKPVIVATQMLESMMASPSPTRAEASDVAAAVYAGADAVMLSGESAAGAYPVEAVAMMDRIITCVEADPHYRGTMDADHTASPDAVPQDAIARAVRGVNEQLPVSANVAFTSSGATSLRLARERPLAPIVSVSPHLATVRRMTLAWGVHSFLGPDIRTVEEMVEEGARIGRREGFVSEGKPYVLVAGMPFGSPGATNLLRIAWG